jgi:hypothetical protein
MRWSWRGGSGTRKTGRDEPHLISGRAFAWRSRPACRQALTKTRQSIAARAGRSGWRVFANEKRLG